MKLGPFVAGWMLLDDDDIAAMALDSASNWQALCLGVSGTTYFYGLMFALRPVVRRLLA